MLLGAGEGTDATNKKVEFSTTTNDGKGGYYETQLLDHAHAYNEAATPTSTYALTKNQIPRQDFTLRFYMAVGGDKENILR